jgi:hypothetical protein
MNLICAVVLATMAPEPSGVQLADTQGSKQLLREAQPPSPDSGVGLMALGGAMQTVSVGLLVAGVSGVFELGIAVMALTLFVAIPAGLVVALVGLVVFTQARDARRASQPLLLPVPPFPEASRLLEPPRLVLATF